MEDIKNSVDLRDKIAAIMDKSGEDSVYVEIDPKETVYQGNPKLRFYIYKRNEKDSGRLNVDQFGDLIGLGSPDPTPESIASWFDEPVRPFLPAVWQRIEDMFAELSANQDSK